jgi:hypothetical protein
MSEGPPPDTPDAAIRGYFSMLSWIVILEGVSMILHGENYFVAIAAVAAGTVLFYGVYKWEWIKNHVHPKLVDSIGRIATNAQWWVALVMIALIGVIFSPYFERDRLPFAGQSASSIPSIIREPPSEDDVTRATAPIRSERDAALSKLTNATKELNDLRQQNEALKRSPEQQNAEKVARYIKLKELLKKAEEARSILLTFDIHSAMRTWPTNRESQNQNRFYREALRPMLNSDQAIKDISNNAYGKTLDLDKSPPEVVNLLFNAPGEEDFQDPAVRTEYRRLYFTNENYKKEADSLLSKLRLDFASISEAIANTPAGDSAIKD